MMMRIFLMSYLLCSQVCATSQTLEKHFDSIQAIDIQIDAGQVTIESSEEAQTSWTQTFDTPQCQAMVDTKDNTLMIKSMAKAQKCEAAYRISLPRRSQTKILIGGGQITLKDMAAPVTINMGGGQIQLKNIDADVSIALGHGKITFDANALPKAPRTLSLQVGSGDIALFFPTQATAFYKNGHPQMLGGSFSSTVKEVDAHTCHYIIDVALPVGSMKVRNQ